MGKFTKLFAVGALMLLGACGGSSSTAIVQPPIASSPPPTPVPPVSNHWVPRSGDTWQWQIRGTINVNYAVNVYDIDLFDAPQATLNALKAQGKHVVCYFSAGSSENWRPDFPRFLATDMGNDLTGWPGEKWLDTRSDNVRAIVKSRLDMAVSKGCEGVEPDNVDGYANNSGFPLTSDTQLEFNRFLASEAHQRGLAIALKNDLGQIASLASVFDFAVNEQCFAYNECNAYSMFTQLGKPVFNAEYAQRYQNNTAGARDALCAAAKAANIHTLVLPLQLDDSFRYSCDDGLANNIVQRPFGLHATAYAAGSIQPNDVSQSQMDTATSAFYDAWKSRYLVNGCGSDRYYVLVADTPGGGKAPNSISVSEGHGYGMMIVALMAGYDPNAKKYFDGMFKYFKDHPATSSPNLMAWNQVVGCGNSGSPYSGSGTATDGDLDIAYALILADRQWGSAGAVNYFQEAKNVIAAVKTVEVNPSTQAIMLGDFADPLRPNFYYGARPSDFMPEHFRAYQAATQDSSWTGAINELYSIIAAIRANYSPVTGLVPDFVINTNASAQPAGPNYLETTYDGEYNYNACRVPWRIGTDYLVSGDPRALTTVQTINAWIKSKTGSNPANIVDGYTLAGATSVGATGTSLAFVGPFAVSAMSDSSNQAWLNSLWSQMTSTPVQADDYYGNTLKLLSMLVVSKNWWSP